MNKVGNTFLLAGEMLMPELHLRQPGFSFTACGPLTKRGEKIQKFRERSDLYMNELHEDCFAHDTGYSDSKDLSKKTISHKVLKDRAYEIARNPKYYGYQIND